MSFGSTRQRWITVSLGLAAAGWLIDTTLLRGTPATARAAPSAGPVVTAAPTTQPDLDSVVRGVLEAFTNTEELALPSDLRDPFVPTEALREIVAPAVHAHGESEEHAAEPPMAPPTPPPDMSETYVLQAVMSGRAAQVVVNGRILRVGEWIDGHRLVRISATAAIFEKDGQLSVLRLKRTWESASQDSGTGG